MGLVQVYVHSDATREELSEEYDLSEQEAGLLHAILSEVDLIIDLESKRVVAVGGMQVSDEVLGEESLDRRFGQPHYGHGGD